MNCCDQARREFFLLYKKKWGSEIEWSGNCSKCISFNCRDRSPSIGAGKEWEPSAFLLSDRNHSKYWASKHRFPQVHSWRSHCIRLLLQRMVLDSLLQCTKHLFGHFRLQVHISQSRWTAKYLNTLPNLSRSRKVFIRTLGITMFCVLPAMCCICLCRIIQATCSSTSSAKSSPILKGAKAISVAYHLPQVTYAWVEVALPNTA